MAIRMTFRIRGTWIQILEFLKDVLMEFYGEAGRGRTNNRLDFGGVRITIRIYGSWIEIRYPDRGIFESLLYLLLRFLQTTKNKT